MEMFIRNYDFDGFRCDVADAVPLDFWEEGRRRIEAIKPDVIMLAESGQKNEQNTAFDLNYFFAWGCLSDVFRGDEPASKIVEIWQEYMNTLLPGARVIHATENHDIVNESGENRIEKIIGRKGHDAMLFWISASTAYRFSTTVRKLQTPACIPYGETASTVET